MVFRAGEAPVASTLFLFLVEDLGNALDALLVEFVVGVPGLVEVGVSLDLDGDFFTETLRPLALPRTCTAGFDGDLDLDGDLDKDLAVFPALLLGVSDPLRSFFSDPAAVPPVLGDLACFSAALFFDLDFKPGDLDPARLLLGGLKPACLAAALFFDVDFKLGDLELARPLLGDRDPARRSVDVKPACLTTALFFDRARPLLGDLDPVRCFLGVFDPAEVLLGDLDLVRCFLGDFDPTESLLGDLDPAP